MASTAGGAPSGRPGARLEGGARLRRASRQDAAARPLISIITSTFNAGAGLPATIESVRAQPRGDMEWIVVDGGSSDATLALLGQHEDLIEYWCSEPDRGIYDAWNKGCREASGEWLLFIGAGDELGPAQSLAVMARELRRAHPSHDLVYGKLQYLSEGRRISMEEVGEPWEKLRGKWELMRPALPLHGAVFHHRSLFGSAEPFDTRLRIAADAKFLLQCIFRKPPLFVPQLVSRAPLGGVSFRLTSAAQMAKEIRSMTRELGLTPPLSHRVVEELLVVAKDVLGRFGPERAAYRIADLYRAMLGKPRRWTVK